MSHSSGTIGIVNLTDNDVEESVFSRNANRNPGDLHRSSGQFRLSRWIRKRKKAGGKERSDGGWQKKDRWRIHERRTGPRIVNCWKKNPGFFFVRSLSFLLSSSLRLLFTRYKVNILPATAQIPRDSRSKMIRNKKLIELLVLWEEKSPRGAFTTRASRENCMTCLISLS